MKYKMICIDMDGTLLNDDKNISSRNHEALKMAQEKGVKVVVSTGRLFTSANNYADAIGIKVPVISSNGAYIREKDRDEVIYENKLDLDKCKKIIDIAYKYDTTVYVNTITSVIATDINGSTEFYRKINSTLPPDRRIEIIIAKNWEEAFSKYKDSIIKCLVSTEEYEKLDKIREEILSAVDVEIASSAINNIEIMNKGVSKGRAVEILGLFYNINKEEIICIGDSENDISMLKFAGLGVAMGNADDKVKSIANYVTDTNNNDGVAKVIEKFILNND